MGDAEPDGRARSVVPGRPLRPESRRVVVALRRRLIAAAAGLGAPGQRRAIVLFAAVLGLSSADTATIGASATQLRQSLGMSNTDLGILLTTSALVGALATLPVGVWVDRTNRTRMLACAVAAWGAAMVVGAGATSFGFLLVTRVALGGVTAVAGPAVASLIGDVFPAGERGRIYGWVLSGELIGTGVGFVGAGLLATFSWRASFLLLAVPSAPLVWFLWRLPEPARTGVRTSSPHEPAPEPSAAQRAVLRRQLEPDAALVLTEDPQRMPLWAAVRYVLRIRTNVVLIIAGVCGYFFFAGVSAFGLELVKGRYGLAQGTASTLILVLGVGALAGVIVGGRLSDRLIGGGRPTGRVLVAIPTLLAATALFGLALISTTILVALPLLTAAAFALAALNPSLDAARLDIMHPSLWGRAEAVRTVLRRAGEAAAPLLFGVVSDQVFGGGALALRNTFLIMLVPLFAGSLILLAALRTYPRDVATAARSIQATQEG